MTRPASMGMKVAKSGGPLGKQIKPGSSFAEVDWDKAAEALTGQHATDDNDLSIATQIAFEEVRIYREEGRHAAARRVSRELEEYTNARLAIRSSWCPTCLNFLHRCSCPTDPSQRGASVEVVDRIFSQMPTQDQLKTERRAEKKRQMREARMARKAMKRKEI